MLRVLSRIVSLTALALVAAVGALLALTHPRYQFGTLVGDDAGYYLAVARNACLGHGFSFDRIHPTNGFNPLMPMLLIPLDRLLAPGLDLLRCFRIATLTTWAVLCLGLLPLRSLASRVLAAYGFPEHQRPLATASVTLLVAGFVALKGYYGMDAFLVFTLGLAWLARVASSGVLARGIRAALLDGLLLGATVLARVDTLPLAAAGFALMLVRARDRANAWGSLAMRALVFAAVVVPYLLWCRLRFGDWLPISARLKSSFPHVDLPASLGIVLHSSLNRADELALAAALALATGWTVMSLAGQLRERGDDEHARARDAMFVFSLYLMARLAWLLAFSRLDVQGSYFILAHPFLALVVLVVSARAGGARAAAAACAVVCVLALGLCAGKLVSAAPEVRAIAAGRGDEWEIGRHVHDAIGDGDAIFGGAFGLIGFVADRPWMNGDGVANEPAYQDAIRRGRLAEYLSRSGVTHVVVASSPPREPGSRPLTLNIESTLYGTTDSLTVDPGHLVLEETMRRNGGTSLWLIKWRHAHGASAPDTAAGVGGARRAGPGSRSE